MTNMAMMLSGVRASLAQTLTIGSMDKYQLALGSPGMYISISAGYKSIFHVLITRQFLSPWLRCHNLMFSWNLKIKKGLGMYKMVY